MARRTEKRRKSSRLLGSHQKSWLWGRNVVLETLRAGRWTPLEIRLSEDLSPAEIAAVREHYRSGTVATEPAARLSQLCGSREHQGHLAKMPSFPYDAADDLIARFPANPLCLILDGLQDPYNFGAVLRSAEVLGVDAVFVGEERQCDVTSQVARSSSGAVNFVPLARVPSLPALAVELKRRGVRLIGASEKAIKLPSECDLTSPAAIVIGNEGTGMSDELKSSCDELVRIPQSGRIGSLNAAVAAGILVYETGRQRGTLPKT